MHEYGCKGDKRYVVNLVLKGGMFLYTISNYEGRPTMDIDFMLRRMSNDVAEYSCAITPQVRQAGNRLSGLTETAYASLLA